MFKITPLAHYTATSERLYIATWQHNGHSITAQGYSHIEALTVLLRLIAIIIPVK